MKVFENMEEFEHEKVLYAYDKKTGLKAIIAIHDTTLGPACGGTRFWNYETEEEALFDVLRLSRGMTLKNAAAGLKVGGGKAVIIGDPKKLKSKEFFEAYGRIVNTLGGEYFTAEDVNISTKDIDMVNTTTKYVMGTTNYTGNPSPYTARGVYKGMKAGAKVKFGTDDLKDKVIAVQGLGSVGMILCRHLHEEGAKLLVTDINQDAINNAVNEFGATAVSLDEIVSVDCDIFAPCALGAVLNKENVHNLKAKMICGAANNVLLDADTGVELEKLDILYLPDYIVNAGGIINCEPEALGNPHIVDEVNKKVDGIYETTIKIIELAKDKKISTYDAAEMYAYEVINNAKYS